MRCMRYGRAAVGPGFHESPLPCSSSPSITKTSAACWPVPRAALERSAHERDRHHRRRSLGHGALRLFSDARGSTACASGLTKRKFARPLRGDASTRSFFPAALSQKLVTSDQQILQEAIDGADIVVSVMPSQHCRSVCSSRCARLPAPGNADRQRDQRHWKKIRYCA